MATIASLASVTALVFASPALADHEGRPTPRELLDMCEAADYCEFHPAGQPEYFVADRRVVGTPVSNCTKDPQRNDIKWSDTTGQSDSIGGGLVTEAKFFDVFEIKYHQTYKRTWERSHTTSQTSYVTTAPGETGWIERGAQMQRVKGTYELHFGSPYYGHYYWYQPYEITGPAPDGKDAISPHTRKMTQSELDSCPR
jgi:hypothetical protein